MRNGSFVVCICAAVSLMTGCASQDVVLPTGTLVLGEVTHFLTPEQVSADELGPGTKVKNLPSEIRAWGFTADQIASKRVAVVREGIYWHNTASGITRDMLHAALIPSGLKVRVGNIIEGIEGPPYTISRVRAENLSAGACYYDELPTGVAVVAMGLISLVGPRGAATLYCKGIENEGWQRPRSYWHKLPNAGVQEKK